MTSVADWTTVTGNAGQFLLKKECELCWRSNIRLWAFPILAGTFRPTTAQFGIIPDGFNVAYLNPLAQITTLVRGLTDAEHGFQRKFSQTHHRNVFSS